MISVPTKRRGEKGRGAEGRDGVGGGVREQMSQLSDRYYPSIFLPFTSPIHPRQALPDLILDS